MNNVYHNDDDLNFHIGQLRIWDQPFLSLFLILSIHPRQSYDNGSMVMTLCDNGTTSWYIAKSLLACTKEVTNDFAVEHWVFENQR